MAIPSWLSISQLSGSGDTLVTITAATYSEFVERTSSLLVSGITKTVTVPVTQKNRIPVMTISPNSISVLSASTTSYITVTAEKEWTATSASNWFTFSPTSGGSGTTTVQVDIDTYTGGGLRNSTIYFNDGFNNIPCSINQAGKEVDVNVGSLYFNHEDDLLREVEVFSFSSGWTVTSKPEWIFLGPTAGTPGTTVMTVMADYFNYTNNSARTGTIRISNGSDSVNISVGQYYENLSARYSDVWWVPQSGGTKSFNIYTGTTIDWTASTVDDWFTFTPTTGKSSTAYTMSVTANANSGSDSRSGKIVFTAKNTGTKFTVSLNQAGTGAYGNVIYYKTTGNTATNITYTAQSSWFGATLVSNTYENGQGALTFASQVTQIPVQAFAQNRQLKEIVIPSTVKTVGKSAFMQCSNLKVCDIPSNVDRVLHGAFYECGFDSFTIPSNIKVIDTSVLRLCSGMTSLTIAEGVEEARGSSLAGLYALTGLTLPNSLQKLNGDFTMAEGMFANSQVQNITFTIPNGTKYIPPYSLGYSRAVAIVLPSSIKAVGRLAFQVTPNITDLYVYARTAPVLAPNSLQYIGLNNNPSSQTNGVLHYPAGSDYSTWIAQLPGAWTARGDL